MTPSHPPLPVSRPAASVFKVTHHPVPPPTRLQLALAGLGAVICFHVAYSTSFSIFIFGYVGGLVTLARQEKTTCALYSGWLVGFLCVAPQLAFFYGIFGTPAISLWAVLAAWTAAFVGLSQLAVRRLGLRRAIWLIPFLWTGLEYFRSELYPLRFSWLNIGDALPNTFPLFHILTMVGVYGAGFAVVAMMAGFFAGYRWSLLVGVLIFGACDFIGQWWRGDPPAQPLRLAGAQMENPSLAAVLENLDGLAKRFPDAPLYVLSEYTFDGPVPDQAKAWCRDHGKYLIAGGKAPANAAAPPIHSRSVAVPLASTAYYNTAFVVGPTGEIVFQQAKSVPIQFFDDGLPAPSQRVWNSPWGKIGICICYDLSYRRVTDRLVALGAQAIIVPTMDAESWGHREHALHTRVAPVRAAEYGIPVFRLASSGISQAVAADGREIARAPFPGNTASLSATLAIGPAGTLPWDRFIAPLSVAVTAGFVVSLFWLGIQRRSRSLVPGN